ncbi:MAG: TAXI family TRAP transporter solute-binding subunit [Sedimentibacter sp.]
MKKGKKTKELFALLLVVLLVLSACTNSSSNASNTNSSNNANSTNNSAATDSKTNQKTNMRFGGSTTSTWVYGYSVAMAEVVNEKLTDIVLNVEATSGSSAHYMMLDNKELSMATGSTFTDAQAMEGKGIYDKKFDTICSLMPINLTYCQVVVDADSEIEKMQDLQDKRVAIGGRGSPTSLMSEELLNALGINAQLSVSTHEEMLEMFKDNRVDAIVYFGGAPYSGILDIASGRDIRLIPFTAEEQTTINNKIPSLSIADIPKSAYNFLVDDVPVVRSLSDVLINKDISEDVVYNIIKSTFDNWDDIVATVPAAGSIGIEDATSLIMPIHPGAVKYYEENGVKIPDNLKIK